MSPIDFKSAKMGKNEAKKLVSKLMVDESCLIVPFYAQKRMKERGLILLDVINVLKSPAMRIVKEPDYKDGSWRYNCETNKFRIAISFSPDGLSISVVTVMRSSL